jgi:hypothetical protein
VPDFPSVTELGNIPQPDPSVAQVLLTAIPQSLLSDPKALGEAAQSAADGNPPAWIDNLPDSAKSYVSEVQDYVASLTGSGDVPSSTGGSDDSSSDSGSEGATSTGGAPAPTGAIAASFAGAIGILGLAVAL